LCQVITTFTTGITALNGLTDQVQNFATPGTTGTAPNWNSVSPTHTLNIPLANTASVTAGLISKTDFDVFSAKLSQTLANTNIFVGNASNVATGVAMSGDTTIANTGAVTIANNAVTYAKMQAVSATSKLLGSSSTTTPVQEITLGTNLSMSGTTLNASSGVTPAALTKVDDTNVTLTLGGTPSTALLQATSLTLGWTGTLADARIASAATWNAKQAALVSGTNIKTINSTSLLGSGNYATPFELVIAASDETTSLTIGTAKITFRMPRAVTLSSVRASLTTAQTSGTIFTVNIKESGTTILSTKITINNTQKTSTTATTPPVISDTALADDAEMTIDIDQIGDGTAKGLKVYLIGNYA
jgi:hypothetical protein